MQWFSEPRLRGTALDNNSWVLTYGLDKWDQPEGTAPPNWVLSLKKKKIRLAEIENLLDYT